MEQQEHVAHEQVTDIENKSQFLSFQLHNELYGVEILKVEEIRVWENPTFLPRTPNYLCGVINLRGMIVPILDLRIRFQLGSADYLATTSVIFVRGSQAQNSRLMGLVVDSVADVITLENDAIESPSMLTNELVSPFIDSIANVGKQVISILDVDGLLSLESEVNAMEEHR